VSRPQLVVSTLDVRAHVAAKGDGRPSPQVTVLEVFYPKQGGPNPGTQLTVTNLDACVGWEGEGEYLLPLVKGPGGTDYTVARTPRSPGIQAKELVPRIYRYTPSLRWQLEQIGKP
jgi:hypothetical protein